MPLKLHFFILTPSYNQNQFIDETIQSVLAQKQTSLHYLVVDGASSDGTVATLKTFSKQLKWISEKDEGQTDAINKGILTFKKVIKDKKLNPHSCVFAYLNSDDVYTNDALQIVATHFTKDKTVQWLVGDAHIINEVGDQIQPLVRLYKLLGRMFLSWPLLLIVNPIPQPATFMRWPVVEKVGYFNSELHYVMDYEYWLRTWKIAGRPTVTNKTLASFRIHNRSKGGTAFIRQFAEQLMVARLFTNNKLLLWLQKLHNAAIVFVYSVIK